MTEELLPGDAIGDVRTFTATMPGVVDSVGLEVQLVNPAGQTVSADTVALVGYGVTEDVDGVEVGTATFSWSYVIPYVAASTGLWYWIVKTTGDIVSVTSEPFVVGPVATLTPP